MIYAVMIVMCICHAAGIIYMMHCHARDEERWRAALCAKERIVVEHPEIKSPETAQARNLRLWRTPEEDN